MVRRSRLLVTVASGSLRARRDRADALGQVDGELLAHRHGLGAAADGDLGDRLLPLASGLRVTRRTADQGRAQQPPRSEEHTSETQSLMRIPYAVFCFKN